MILTCSIGSIWAENLLRPQPVMTDGHLFSIAAHPELLPQKTDYSLLTKAYPMTVPLGLLPDDLRQVLGQSRRWPHQEK